MIDPVSIIAGAKVVRAVIGKFFGGGASYAMIGITAFLLFQMWQINHIKDDRDEYKKERNAARIALAGKDAALETQAKQNSRGKDLDKQGDDAREKINEQEIEFKCASSKSIIAGFDWVRDFDAGRTADHNDAANVPMQRAAGDAK